MAVQLLRKPPVKLQKSTNEWQNVRGYAKTNLYSHLFFNCGPPQHSVPRVSPYRLLQTVLNIIHLSSEQMLLFNGAFFVFPGIILLSSASTVEFKWTF